MTAATPMAMRYSFWNLSSTTSWGGLGGTGTTTFRVKLATALPALVIIINIISII